MCSFKKVFSQKINTGWKKRKIWRWFESGQKVAKLFLQKKILTLLWTNFVLIHLLVLWAKDPLALDSVTFLQTFSSNSKSASNSVFFDTHIELPCQICCWVILALYATFKQNTHERARKKVNNLDTLYLLKNGQYRCTILLILPCDIKTFVRSEKHRQRKSANLWSKYTTYLKVYFLSFYVPYVFCFFAC